MLRTAANPPRSVTFPFAFMCASLHIPAPAVKTIDVAGLW
jgi:hypothetical protein